MRSCIIVRGQTLDFDKLFACDIASPQLVAQQRTEFLENKPFEHIVIDGLFNADLLRLIGEEFPEPHDARWKNVSGKYETTYRSKCPADLGPAAQTYFNLVNSHIFVRYLSAITDIPHLITDHSLAGGGLHETRAGGRFSVHRDFNYHHENMLANTLVFLTYLNTDWQQEYGGALELWDRQRRHKVVEVEPIFGRSILFRHSKQSFHGHPTPLAPPFGRSRRSLATYYYVNHLARYRKVSWRTSSFLEEAGQPFLQRSTGRTLAELGRMNLAAKLKFLVHGLTPPMLWSTGLALRDAIQNRRSLQKQEDAHD
jgi:Rps23 Pro-64 3,4-dihydroxylase Tpa1-like proline 4-hydroxylase